MKIDIIGPTYPYRGGIAHYTTLLVKHLNDAGHAVKLYSYTRQYPKFLFPGKTDRDPSSTALRVPAEYIVDPINPLTWLRVFNRVRRDNPDMLILQWWVPYWTPSLAAISHLVKHYSRVKIVYVCHNVTPHEESGTLDHRLAWVVLKRGDAFIVHSEQDRRKLTALLPRPPVWRTSLPNFTDFEQFKPAGDASSLRKQLGLDGKRVLLFFGFVRPYKGLQYLIQALPLVRKQLPDAHLLVVGEFWSSKWEYIAYAEEAGVADMVTFVDHYIPNEEVQSYFDCADVVVLPFVSATQSGSLQLTLGMGTPVITTRVGGIHETVRDGYNGIVVPPQNEEALAEAIVRFYEQDMGPHLRANIAAEREAGRFGWAETINVLEQIDRQLRAGARA